jgi:hypothetical protein
MKHNHLLLAMTFVGVLLVGPSLFAQQEVDPTWYDPWGGPTQVASHPVAAPHVAKAENHPKVDTSLTKLRSEKLRASDTRVIQPGQGQPQPVQSATSEEKDLGMPSKGYLSSVLVAEVPY